MWESIDAFKTCGQVEGLASSSGGTSTAGGDTLGVPDGPFSFATESTIFPLIDSVTRVSPGGGPAGPGGPAPGGGTPMGICGSTADHCSAVQNGDGQPCTQPAPGTPPNCWGRPDFSSQPPQFVNFSDAECQQVCYQMNLYGFGGHNPELSQVFQTNSLCVEEGILDMSLPPGENQVVRLGTPMGRFLLDVLNYSCDDAASVVHRFATEIIGLPPTQNSQPGPPTACHVTRRAEITLKMESPSKIIGDFKQAAALAADDAAACADDSNPQNPIAHMIGNPVRMLFTLTRQ
jgi:hypothetical protein